MEPDANPTERVDERDTMFARMARSPRTSAYDDFYERRPELREADDRLRSLPVLCQPGGRHYDPAISPQADAYFDAIGDIRPEPGRVLRAVAAIEEARENTDAWDGTAALKGLAHSLGAVAAGCAAVDPAFVYTHKGRLDEDYGRPVTLDHPSALVFLVEMAYDAMRRAPEAPVIRESARQYYRAAVIGKTIAAVLHQLGYAAKPHYDAHYDVILPPLAVRAGLGELGRNNLLVADRYGSRVRIGAVTTDFPLTRDAPVSLGVREFCRVCRKCADNCPPRALSDGEPVQVRGVCKWPTRVEQCYGYWRHMGTDCGICMAGCPFSHRDTWFHGAVRRTLRRMPWLARLAVLGDDLVYGRHWPAR
ncbi:MAG: reductive dehalogenase domain-containing protein [Gemmatimonadota bacterium]